MVGCGVTHVNFKIILDHVPRFPLAACHPAHDVDSAHLVPTSSGKYCLLLSASNPMKIIFGFYTLIYAFTFRILVL